MAGRNYLSNPNNSFFAVEDDDVDDDTFLKNSRQAQKLQEIEDRALRSAQASISILRETEDIGVKTAEVSDCYANRNNVAVDEFSPLLGDYDSAFSIFS